MPLKMEPLEEPQLNLTPMIDIVLLLVIFFMVGTQFTESESQYDIELPTVTQAAALTGGPDELTVEVRRDGQALLDGQPIDDDTLTRRLQEAKARYKGQAVIFRGDQAIDYQRVMSVISLVKGAGITNIQLANRLSAETP